MAKELLSRPAARTRAGNISRSTEQRLEATDPTWPRRVWITPGRSGYYADEIEQWCAARERVRRRSMQLDSECRTR
jgi:predicted DNA-binding transcriptional regulator AlpA